jgi:hypothetical protein
VRIAQWEPSSSHLASNMRTAWHWLRPKVSTHQQPTSNHLSGKSPCLWALVLPSKNPVSSPIWVYPSIECVKLGPVSWNWVSSVQKIGRILFW